MKQLTLILILLLSFVKTKVLPIKSSTKIVVSPSINVNCTMGTVRVCPGSIHRHCYCEIDLDSSPLKTAMKCSNGTRLQWLEDNKEFTPICMNFDDPNKPFDCPSGYEITYYKSNSSKLIPYCSKEPNSAKAKRFIGFNNDYLLPCDSNMRIIKCWEDEE